MTIVRATLVALMMSTALATQAEGAPIVVAVAGTAFASSIPGVIISSLLSAGISWVGAQVIGALFPADKEEIKNTKTDRRTQVQYGERVYRSGIIGTVMSAGHLAHINEYANATVLQMVHIHADQRISDIKKVLVNGKLTDITLVSNTSNSHKAYTVDGYNSKLRLRLHDGRVGQAADTNLVDQTEDWDSTKKYSGMAYIVTEVDSDEGLFNGNPPEIVPILEGGVWYDIRKDSTAGGSGTHRFNDPSTWEYTANPFVIAYHFLRGVYFNGVRVLGAGYAHNKLDIDSFITAMNVADEEVTTPDDRTRNRYECHMLFSDQEAYGDVLEQLCESAGGYWASRGGKISVFAGKAKLEVLTFTDDDLISDEDTLFEPKRAGETKYSGIQGTYTSSQDFSPKAYTPIEPAEFLPTNAEPRILEYSIDQVKDPHQAFLLAKMKLFANNVQGGASVCFDIKDMLVQVGDWVVWNSDIPAVGERTFEVRGTQYDFKRMRMYLTLSETSADIYDDDSTADDIAEESRSVPTADYLLETASLVIETVALVGTDGTQIPALDITYNSIFDPGILGVDIQYRVKGTTEPVFNAYDNSPSDGRYITSTNVVGGERYEVRTRLNSISGRVIDWGEWTEAIEDTPTFTVAAEVPDNSITIQQLAQDLKNITGPGWNAIWNKFAEFDEQLGDLANVIADNSIFATKRVTGVSARSTSAAAAILRVEEIIIGPGSAFAALTETVTAIADNVYADGMFKIEAEVDELMGKTTILFKAKATNGDFSDEAALRLGAIVTESGSESFIDMMADRMGFISTAGDFISQPFAIESGFVKILTLRFENLLSLDGDTIVIDGVTGFVNFSSPA